jgi:hypothetical protein
MANVLAGTATSITALSQAANLAGSLSNLILATPQNKTQGYQPQNKPSPTGLISTLFPPPSLLFHYEGEQTVTLQSDITDHFIENNTAIQDQISLKPIVITTHGFIGELNNVPPPELALLLQASNTLTSIGAYVPGLSQTAQLAYAQAFAAYQTAQSAVNAGISAWSSITGTGGTSVVGSGGLVSTSQNQNKQQTYFQQFYGYWNTRTLFTVQTPWAIFQNMAIQNLRAIQDEATRMITDFEVSFKMINVARTALGNTQLQTQGRLQNQSFPLENNGTGSITPNAKTIPAGVTGVLATG